MEIVMVNKNKLGITDEAQLQKKEEEITKRKTVELFEKGMFAKYKAGTLDALLKLHKYLFDEIYDYAGKLRTVDIQDCVEASNLKQEAEKVNKMPQSNIEEIIQKFVFLSSLNPFLTGNGRVMRIWLDIIIRKELAYTVAWSEIDPESYMQAIEIAPKSILDIKYLIENALSQELEGREFYIKNLDASFALSGYKTYRTRLLG